MEHLIRGINMDSIRTQGLAHRVVDKNNPDYEEYIDNYLTIANKEIQQERAEVYENSMGLKASLYKNLPQLLTREDVVKMVEHETIDYPFQIIVEGNKIGFHNLGEIVSVLKLNIDRNDIYNMLYQGCLRNFECEISVTGKQMLEKLYNK